MNECHSCFEEVADRVAEIDGLLWPGQEKFLFDAVKRLPNDAVIVEIGSFTGRSTISMALACKGTDRRIYSIDTWNGNDADFNIRDFYLNWAGNVIRNGVEAHVLPLVGLSSVVMPLWKLVTNGKKIDMLFIDGSHIYRDVVSDFYHSYEHVNDGGWIFFHDITTDGLAGPHQVWRELASEILVDHRFESTLGGGRKHGELPRWASLFCKKVMSLHDRPLSEF
jgi:predicted O-methyltransferase YrrM